MKIKQLFFGLILLASFFTSAQCFEIESVLVDACGSPEGENEMVRFKVGNVDLCTNDLFVDWPSNSWLGLSQNATTAQATADLNATIISCGFLLEPTTCILPANSTVILVTSEAIDVTANSFANLSDTIYIIFQTVGNTNGHFANYNSAGGLRTLSLTFSNPVNCTDTVTYDRGNLVNINGTTGGTTADKNGSTVEFDPAGTPTYVNNGCQAPFNPFVINLAAAEVVSGTQNFCPGDILGVAVNVSGPYQEIIWTGNDGTFDAQNVTTTNYNSALTDTLDFYIYVGVVNICNDTVVDSVLFTVNPFPTVSNAGPFTTFSGTQQIIADVSGGTWTSDCGACLSSTGVFDPAISGQGTFQICYTAGCGQDCISILVNDNCTMTWVIDSSNPVCYGGNDGDVNINVSGVNGSATYLITDSTGTQLNSSNASPTANNLAQGWYYLSVTDNLCTIIDSVFLDDPDSLIVQHTVIEPNCYGVADGLAFVDTVLNHQGTYDQMTFQWSQGSIGVDVVTNDSLYNIGENTYFLTVTDSANCQDVLTFNVTYPDSLYFTQLDFTPTVCRNQNPYDNGGGQVFAAAAGGSDGNGNGTNFSYVWTEDATGATTVNTTWPGRNPGYYTIVATNDLGCTISETIYVDSLSPQAIFTLTSNEFTSAYEGTAPVSIELTNQSINYAFSNDPNADTTFIWTFGLDSTAYVSSDINEVINQQYLAEGEYEICLVVIENLNGCQDTACQTIIVHDLPSLDIPNVFTPGINGVGDNVNDKFFFPNNAIVNFNCKVYDRWGKIMFEFTTIDDQWDGTNYKNGNDCSDGVYFYVYEGESSNGTIYKGQGNIHLIRK